MNRKRLVWFWRLDYDDSAPSFLISTLRVWLDDGWSSPDNGWWQGHDVDDGKLRGVPCNECGVYSEGVGSYLGYGNTREEAVESAKKAAQALASEVIGEFADRVTLALVRGAKTVEEM